MQVEDTLEGYFSHGGVSPLKSPVLPTKPFRTSPALVGKEYIVVLCGVTGIPG